MARLTLAPPKTPPASAGRPQGDVEAMVIIMRRGASDRQVDDVVDHIRDLGLKAHLSRGEEITIIGVVGDDRPIEPEHFETLDGVDRVQRILPPYKLASRDFRSEDTIIEIGDVKIGGNRVVIMAGPCGVESREQLLESARIAKQGGAQILRGGAFKPRTSPYSFQGMGQEGLEILAEAKAQTGLLIVSEVISPQHVEQMYDYIDIYQIGARNMQNFPLLNEVGKQNKPVLLKRGMAATVQDLLMAAEYVLSNGNYNVILCERGIRTFETATRNTTDINAVPVLQKLSHLPVIVDPSHGTGHWDLVPAVAKAAVAAGADGLIIEIHPDPAKAKSDGAQSLKPGVYYSLMDQLDAIACAVGRSLRQPQPAPALA